MSKWRWPMKTALFKALAEDAIANSGGTYIIRTLPYEYAAVAGAVEYRAETVRQGFAVGVVSGPIISDAELQEPSCYTLGGLLKAWHGKYKDELTPQRALGLWYHEGFWHIDIVEIMNDRSLAIERAVRRGELAIYDLSKGEEIKVKDN